MKKAVAAAACLVAGALGAMPAQAQSVSYFEAQKVEDTFVKGGGLAAASDLTVSANHRSGPGKVEMHDKETDVFYIVQGDALFVTGGTMIGGRQVSPGQTLGTDIQGGQALHLKKGDVVIIPAGIPHWFKEVSAPIDYLTIKVLKP